MTYPPDSRVVAMLAVLPQISEDTAVFALVLVPAILGAAVGTVAARWAGVTDRRA